jgi:hypothetical protein
VLKKDRDGRIWPIAEMPAGAGHGRLLGSICRTLARLSPRHLRQSDAGCGETSPTTLRASRAAELDASDEDDAARAALATVEATLPERETELLQAKKCVTAVADNVIASDVACLLLREAEAVPAELLARRVVLRHLSHNGLAGEAEKAVTRFLHDIDLPATYGMTVYQDWGPASGGRAKALTRDADAALPTQ